MALGPDQTGPRETGQMRRHGILRNAKLPGDVTRGEAIGLVTDEQPEGIKPCRLRQRAQC